MGKTIKKVLIYILIFMGTIIMLSNIPSNAGVYSDKDMIIWTDGGTVGTKKLSEVINSQYISLGITCFKNKFAFCSEASQNFTSFTSYKVDYKFVIKPNEIIKYQKNSSNEWVKVSSKTEEKYIKYGQGLGRVFSYIDSTDSRINHTNLSYWGGSTPGMKDINLALWWYQYNQGDSDIRAFFNFYNTNPNGKVELTAQGLSYRDGTKVSLVGKEIYNAATNMSSGENYELEMYLLTNSYQQNVLLVDRVEKTLDPEIELKIYKKDTFGGNLAGAEIQISKGDNVKEILGNTTLKSTNDGLFGTIRVKQSSNTGTFKLIVKETKTPQGFVGFGEMTLTVTYDKSTGKVKSVTSNKPTYLEHTSNSTNLNLKNSPVTFITIDKLFDGTKKNSIASDVKVNIKIDGQNSGITLKNAAGTTYEENNGEFKNIPLSGGSVTLSGIQNNIDISITETETNEGYIPMNGTATFSLKYQNGKWTLTKTNNVSNVSADSNNIKIAINNLKKEAEEVIIVKTDKQGNPMGNVVFDLTLTGIKGTVNITDKNGTKAASDTNGIITTKVTTMNDGTIIINGIDVTKDNTEGFYQLGDLDFNGKISQADARTVQRIAEGDDQVDNYSIYDLNSDGYVTGQIKTSEIYDSKGNSKKYVYIPVFDISANKNKCLVFIKNNNKIETQEVYISAEDVNNENQKIEKEIDYNEVPEINNFKYKEGNTLEKLFYVDKNNSLELQAGTYAEIYYGNEQIDIGNAKNYFNDAEYCLRVAVSLEGKLSYFTVKLDETKQPYYRKAETIVKKFYNYNGKLIQIDGERDEDGTFTKILAGEKNVSELNSVESKIVIPVVNEPEPFSIEIQKYDQFGNPLKAGYEFEVTIDNAEKIGESKTNKVTVATNNEGKLVINNIYVDSLNSKITIKETKTGSNLFGKINDTIITKTYNETTKKIEWKSNNEDQVKVESTSEGVKLQLRIEDDIKPNLKIVKVSGNEKLQGAVFTVDVKEGNTTLFSKSNLETSENGEINIGDIDLTSWKGGNLTVNLTETKAPDDYYLPSNPVTTVSLTYNGETFVEEHASAEFKDKTLTVTIQNNKQLPAINLYKLDNLSETYVDGAKFTFEIQGIKQAACNNQIVENKDGKVTFTGVPTNMYTGGIQIYNVTPLSDKGTVTITVTEIETVKGLKKLDKPIVLTYNYNGSDITNFNANLNGQDDYIRVEQDDKKIDIYATNYAVMEQLTLEKIDAVTGKPLPNAEFIIDFGADNVKSFEVKNGDTWTKVEGSSAICTTNASGEILLRNIELNRANITLAITETKVPEGDGCYYKTAGTVYFYITYNGNGQTEGGLTVDGPYATTNKGTTVKIGGNVEKSVTELASGIATNYNLQVTLKNIPFIKLSGQVWVDEQEGDKAATNPNGLKDEETYVNGVKVYLYSVKDNSTIREAITEGDGQYNFEDIEKTEEGYQIHFEYNGIVYNDLGKTPDKDGKYGSDAAEIDSVRIGFNERFKTITNNQSNDGTVLQYDENTSDEKAILFTTPDGRTPENSSIIAYADNDKNNYTRTTENIDCGLIEKFFDLALNNLIANVEYSINGQKWIDTPEGDTTIYSSSMYNSDYYYRFNYYGANNIGFTSIDQNDGIVRNELENIGDELEVRVTYRLVLANQSIHDIDSVKVKYTYDTSKYALETEGFQDTGEIILDIKGSTEQLLTFRLKRGSDGNLLTGEINTTAEIISYTTTEGGLVDVDSNPGNGREKEDDISYAKLTFEIANEKRMLSGNVAEDTNGDGILDSTGINGVIVQLIEIIDDGTNTYEYIWQETVSGTNQVKYRDTSNNIDVYTNSLEEQESNPIKGKYEFLGYSNYAKDSTGNDLEKHTGFIPGNYIIRFIYGDGRVYDLEGKETYNLDNVDPYTYNGQDYKSTADKNYNVADYDKAIYSDNLQKNEVFSKARDNEARRLETMAFSTQIDGGLGSALKTLDKGLSDFSDEEEKLLRDYYKKLYDDENNTIIKYVYGLLNPNNELPEPNSIEDDTIYNIIKCYVSYNTWMCAETSKIKVLDTIEKNTVSFGLMKRPQTILEIEKHITALKITPSGTGVQPIVDARLANLPDIINGNTTDLDITGITTGLAPILSTRNNRGFWYVATDVEELMQGAKLEVEYTYVIKNKTEGDYLSEAVVNEFKANIGKDLDGNGQDDYIDYLMGASISAKQTQKGKPHTYSTYLGKYYYTGAESDKTEGGKVPSTVDTLEEAINNKLSFEENANNASFKITEETKGDATVTRKVYGVNGVSEDPEDETISTIVESTEPSDILAKDGKDFTKTIKLTTTLSATEGGEIGADIPSYIAEITKYSNAAGRQNIAVPENLTYVHSKDNNMTMENGHNEIDEFWGETIIISKPTGEDKNLAMIITITAISAVAVIGVGIILIKKYVIKK